MKYVLIKYKEMRLLINEGLDIAPLLANLHELETLNCKVIDFYKDMLTSTKEEGAALECQRTSLASKIGYKIIGVPFTNHDAELYALDRKLDYTVFDLHGNTGNANAAQKQSYDSGINIQCYKSDKGAWVAAAQADAECRNLTQWVSKILNQAVRKADLGE